VFPLVAVDQLKTFEAYQRRISEYPQMADGEGQPGHRSRARSAVGHFGQVDTPVVRRRGEVIRMAENRAMRLGLRGRNMLIASVLVMLATGVVALVSSYHFTQRIADAQSSRTSAIAQGLAVQLERILALGIQVHQLQGFEEQCLDAIHANPGLSLAMVAAPDGQILFHNEPGQVRARVQSQALRDALGSGIGSFDDVERDRHVALATVVVGFPLATLFVLALLFGALSQQVTRPLSDLVRAMADIRAGKRSYAERLPTNRNDEIGVMVQGFNSLLDRIAERNA
jgi:methyl-accepting chemotaxis protein